MDLAERAMGVGDVADLPHVLAAPVEPRERVRALKAVARVAIVLENVEHCNGPYFRVEEVHVRQVIGVRRVGSDQVHDLS